MRIGKWPYRRSFLSVLAGFFFIPWTAVGIKATTLEERCKGKGLELQVNKCLCQGSQKYINPWSEQEKRNCDKITEYGEVCQGEFFLFRPGLFSCYCRPWKRDIQYSDRQQEAEKCRKEGEQQKAKELLTQMTQIEGLSSSPICPIPPTPPSKLHYLVGRTVEVLEERDGRHGGRHFLVKLKQGEDWDNRIDNPGEQGDSRFGPKALGKELGEFFGFKIISEDQVMVPDFTELKNSLEKFNQKVASKKLPASSRIMIDFYMAEEGQVTQESYLRNFADKLAWPLATEGVYFHHDLNFHVAGALLMPPSILKRLQTTTRHLLGFKTYLQNHHPQLAAEPSVWINLDKAMDHQVNTLDVVTALLTQFLAKSLAKVEVNEKGFLEEMQMSFLSSYAASPVGKEALTGFFTGPFADREVEKQFQRALKEYKEVASMEIEENGRHQTQTADPFTLLHQRYSDLKSVLQN